MNEPPFMKRAGTRVSFPLFFLTQNWISRIGVFLVLRRTAPPGQRLIKAFLGSSDSWNPGPLPGPQQEHV
jgi:hypothetical protein